MPYKYLENKFAGDRPDNVTDPDKRFIAHHRIPWNVLKGVLNKILAREADSYVVNALMRLSPSYDPQLLKEFGAAVKEAKPRRVPPKAQENALNKVEEEILRLPMNLFFGMVVRDDDPGGDCMDFTPDDVDHAGAPRRTVEGRLHGLRMNLFGQLCQPRINIYAVDKKVNEIIRAANGEALNSPKAVNLDHWHPGPTPPGTAVPERTFPAYRFWLKPTGDEMTVDDIKTMICQVTKRARKSGSR